jgi:DNA-binding NtrC family response regulator
MSGRILVVDDEPLKRITLQIELSEQGYEVYEAADAQSARRIFDLRPIDVVVSDVRMPGMNGLDLLAYVKQQRPEVGVILMTAYASVDSAVLAIKRGAYDYLTKPFTTEELLVKLERLLAGGKSAESSHDVERLGALVAKSEGMKRLFQQVRALADSDSTILLCGESGTGKELLAEAIHAQSRRAERPFIRFCCAGSQPGELEGDLFGRERGTPAAAAQPEAGCFELANGGTLLLRDMDEVPREIQVRLLRVIERQEFERVGGEAPTRVDVRLICVTGRDLLPLVKENRFRDDLYYRLNVLSLTIPPLRERPEDIPVLAQHFLQKRAALVGQRPVRLSPHALDELVRHKWPGNVRELEQVLERALVLCAGGEIRPGHVLPLKTEATEPTTWAGLEPAENSKLGLSETIADIERRMILMALQQCDHNQVRAAQRLGIPRTTLRDKMAKYKIPGG